MKKQHDNLLSSDAWKLLQSARNELGWCDDSYSQARSTAIASAKVDGIEKPEARHATEAIQIINLMPHGMLETFGDFYRERLQKIMDCLSEMNSVYEEH